MQAGVLLLPHSCPPHHLAVSPGAIATPCPALPARLGTFISPESSTSPQRTPAPLRLPSGSGCACGWGGPSCASPAVSPEISRDVPDRDVPLFGEAMEVAAAVLRALLLLGGLRPAPTLALLQDPPTIYEGPPGSYFGFALDFYRAEGR